MLTDSYRHLHNFTLEKVYMNLVWLVSHRNEIDRFLYLTSAAIKAANFINKKIACPRTVYRVTSYNNSGVCRL